MLFFHSINSGVQVAGQYLEFLVSQERYEDAAVLMPRLLKVPPLPSGIQQWLLHPPTAVTMH